MTRKLKDWQALAKGVLKAQPKRRGLTCGDLVYKLAAIGIKDSKRNITNFSAVWFAQCLEAIGAKTIHLGDS